MANKSDPFPNLPRRTMFAVEVTPDFKRLLAAGTVEDRRAEVLRRDMEARLESEEFGITGYGDSPKGTPPKRDRKAYMRDYMAKKRAKAKT